MRAHFRIGMHAAHSALLKSDLGKIIRELRLENQVATLERSFSYFKEEIVIQKFDDDEDYDEQHKILRDACIQLLQLRALKTLCVRTYDQLHYFFPIH
jgi:hypothetical protein